MQFILMAISSLVIGYIAMVNVSPATLSQVTPAGWHDLFGFNLALDWGGILPALNGKIVEELGLDDGVTALTQLGLIKTV